MGLDKSASGELSSGACTRHCWPSTRHYPVTQDLYPPAATFSKGDLSFQIPRRDGNCFDNNGLENVASKSKQDAQQL